MRNRIACLLTLLAVATASAVTSTGCKDEGGSAGGGGSAGDVIRIGHYGSMTGATATFGTSTDEGIRLALDEINSGTGVLGKKVEVLTEDTQGKPTEAVSAVEKLINRDDVVAVIGEVASSNSLAAAPACEAAGIPMLTPASTNPKVTLDDQGNVRQWIFRSCFIDPFQGGTMAKFALNDLKAKRLAVLYDLNSDYSQGLRQFFTEEIKRGGGEIVADEAYSQQDVDFRGQLTKIKNVNPDAIYVPGYYTQVGAICRQAKELGITVPLLGGDGWDSDKLFEIGGDTVNGNYFTNHYSAEEQRPEVQQFVEAYKAKYGGKVPDAMAILGYDAMKLMADAITRAGSTDPSQIRDALAATTNFPGASGSITMDKQHNAMKPIVVLKVEDGKTKFITSIKP